MLPFELVACIFMHIRYDATVNADFRACSRPKNMALFFFLYFWPSEKDEPAPPADQQEITGATLNYN